MHSTRAVAGGRPIWVRLRRWRRHTPAYLLLLPSAVLILGVIIYPLVYTLVLSLQHTSAFGTREDFTGLNNYARQASDALFWQVVKQTVVWTAGVVGGTTVLSLGFAVVLNMKFRFRTAVRAIITLPWATSLAFSAIIWRQALDTDGGLVNHTLRALHFISQNVPWLASAQTAFPALIVVGIWVSTPFTALSLLAAMQSISSDLYEAAHIDGSAGWHNFVSITLPGIRHVLTVITLLNCIAVFNSFPIIWIMTGGDPLNSTDILATYIYRVGFKFLNFGSASALAGVVFALLMIFTVIYLRIFRSEE